MKSIICPKVLFLYKGIKKRENWDRGKEFARPTGNQESEPSVLALGECSVRNDWKNGNYILI